MRKANCRIDPTPCHLIVIDDDESQDARSHRFRNYCYSQLEDVYRQEDATERVISLKGLRTTRIALDIVCRRGRSVRST